MQCYSTSQFCAGQCSNANQIACMSHYSTMQSMPSNHNCHMQDYQRLLSSQPARRLNPAKLAESSVLKNKLVDTIAFLENLAVKDSAEKDLFFKRLPQAIPGLPLPVLRRKLLPMLAQALTFGGAPAVALGSILQVIHCGVQILGNTLCLAQMTAQSTAVPTSGNLCVAPHIWHWTWCLYPLFQPSYRLSLLMM